MNPIKESHFIFIDDEGVTKIFLREKYFQFVCLLITDFFKEEIIKNDFYRYFINLFNDLEDGYSLFFIEHQLPTHWALCIIQNKHTIETYTKDNEDRLQKIWSEFIKQNNLKSFCYKPITFSFYIVFLTVTKENASYQRRKHFQP